MVAPIQIVIALYLIYLQVGNATWVGVGYMLFLAPINMFVFSIVSSMRKKVLKYADLRVKMMNEILTGIRIIKLYAWEAPFGKEVGRLRQKELEALTKLAYTTAVGFSIILLSTPIVQPILVFVTYVRIQDEPLSASTAFTTVALFNIMRLPFAFMPMGLLQYIQSKISLKRLERYLALPELGTYIETTAPPSSGADEKGDVDSSNTASSGSIFIRNGTFAWTNPDGPEIKPIQDEKKKKAKKTRKSKQERDASIKSTQSKSNESGGEGEDNNSNNDNEASIHSLETSLVSEEGSRAGAAAPIITLQDITCDIEAGSLVAVVGPVGSGKSSFLSAILGEMEAINGSKVYIPKTKSEEEMHGFASYCTQSPWVINDTLRGNILFGREMDSERYQNVLECCALMDDIAVLPAGDMTEIGVRPALSIYC
jgi:ATP-binding cassette, subfamily C (CFTR/MRP), member 1